MNDQQKLAKIFDEIGVEFSEGFETENMNPHYSWKHPVEHNSFISTNRGDGVDGYWQYFLFMDGKFVSQGVWN
jgi:hypothetical protein